jgi:hypothetical protein
MGVRAKHLDVITCFSRGKTSGSIIFTKADISRHRPVRRSVTVVT